MYQTNFRYNPFQTEFNRFTTSVITLIWWSLMLSDSV